MEKKFQSTLSSRRATKSAGRKVDILKDFNPRSPHGERPYFSSRATTTPEDFNPRSPHGERHRPPQTRVISPAISIHALLTESDDYGLEDGREFSISIHALLTESDIGFMFVWFSFKYFNPRSPHGERRGVQIPTAIGTGIFQSTLSSRRATRRFPR